MCIYTYAYTCMYTYAYTFLVLLYIYVINLQYIQKKPVKRVDTNEILFFVFFSSRN